MIAIIFGGIVKRAIAAFGYLAKLKPTTLAIIALAIIAAYQYWSHGRYVRKTDAHIAKLDAANKRAEQSHRVTLTSLAGCRSAIDDQNKAVEALGEATKQGQKRAETALASRDKDRVASTALIARLGAVRADTGQCRTPQEVFDAKL